MKTLMIAVSLAGLLAGCTMSRGIVKDVHTDASGNLVMEKCDLKGYLAMYVIFAGEENCHEEPVKSTSIVKAH